MAHPLLYSDTIGRSGMFSVISNTIEQCNAETVVDIFQTTKAVRAHKPMAVNTMVRDIHATNILYFIIMLL